LCWRGIEQNEGGERRGEKVASIKKGASDGGRPPFPSRVGEGNEGLWARAGPAGDITPASSSLLFFPFISIPLSGLVSWISMVHPCMYCSTAIEQKNLDSSSLSWIDPA
jgi:hypothetical protein